MSGFEKHLPKFKQTSQPFVQPYVHNPRKFGCPIFITNSAALRPACGSFYTYLNSLIKADPFFPWEKKALCTAYHVKILLSICRSCMSVWGPNVSVQGKLQKCHFVFYVCGAALRIMSLLLCTVLCSILKTFAKARIIQWSFSCNRGMDIFLNHDVLKLFSCPWSNTFHVFDIFKVNPDWYRHYILNQ